MAEPIYQARKTAFLTRRELLRLTLAGALVLLIGTTWRQASVGADSVWDRVDENHRQQISATLIPSVARDDTRFL